MSDPSSLAVWPHCKYRACGKELPLNDGPGRPLDYCDKRCRWAEANCRRADERGELASRAVPVDVGTMGSPKFCYAEPLAKRYGYDVWGATTERRMFPDSHWAQPLSWNADAEHQGRRARVFCGSMMDVFEDHEALPPVRKRLWDLIGRTPSLDWLLLTKRPENAEGMAPWGTSWPANVWLGTSVEDQERARRALTLLRIPAAVTFLSVEPLLGPVDLRHVHAANGAHVDVLAGDVIDPTDGVVYAAASIDWVICGGESGPHTRPMFPDWARLLRDQCVAAGTPFFFKQWGEWAPIKHPYDYVTNDDRVRVLLPDGTLRGRPWPGWKVQDGTRNGEVVRRYGKKKTGRIMVERNEYEAWSEDGELPGRTWDKIPPPPAATAPQAQDQLL